MSASGPLICTVGLVLAVVSGSAPAIVFCACCFLISLALTVAA